MPLAFHGRSPVRCAGAARNTACWLSAGSRHMSVQVVVGRRTGSVSGFVRGRFEGIHRGNRIVVVQQIVGYLRCDSEGIEPKACKTRHLVRVPERCD